MADIALPEEVTTSIRDLVHHLVVGEYESLVIDGRAGRLAAGDIVRVVTRYGRRLVELPENIFTTDAVAVYPQPGDTRRWKVDIDLWTQEEGQSDLTLQLSVEAAPHQVVVRIEDMHVM